MFQLIWNNIGFDTIARFKTDLSTKAFVLLRLKNLALTGLTLGMYRPFARASEYAMKVNSLTLYLKGGIDAVTGQIVKQQSGGLGDAMADAVGIDMFG